MTIAELVKETRSTKELTIRELLEEWADTQSRILALERRLDAIEDEARNRGYSL